jgi:hypothetical protein
MCITNYVSKFKIHFNGYFTEDLKVTSNVIKSPVIGFNETQKQQLYCVGLQVHYHA